MSIESYITTCIYIDVKLSYIPTPIYYYLNTYIDVKLKASGHLKLRFAYAADQVPDHASGLEASTFDVIVGDSSSHIYRCVTHTHTHIHISMCVYICIYIYIYIYI